MLLATEKITGLFAESAKLVVIAWVLLALAQSAAAAGFSMGCSERPAHSAARDRWAGSVSNRGVSGRPEFRRSSWAGRELSQAARPGSEAPPRSLLPPMPPATGIRVDPPANSPHPRQPEWVEKLYAKFPVHSRDIVPALGYQSEMAHGLLPSGVTVR